MVFCSKCGTQNPDTNTYCQKCGTPLTATGTNNQPQDRYAHRSPYRAMWGAVLGGVVLLIIGLSFLLSTVYSVTIVWWPVVLIAIGVFLIVRWILLWPRRRR
jgi:uncharacterized membrane protein YvbJ